MRLFFKLGKFLVIALAIMWLSGCSTVHYSAQNKPMINLKGCDNATTNFEHKMTGNFYFCGLTPGELEIDLTQIAQENGAPNGLCDVSIEEKVTFGNGLVGMCTLGILVPRTITIKAKKIGD